MREEGLRDITDCSKPLGTAKSHLALEHLRMIGLRLAAAAYLRGSLRANFSHERVQRFFVGKSNCHRVRALRQNLQLVRTCTIACSDKLQVSPLRMTIKPSCSGRDDSSGVIHV